MSWEYLFETKLQRAMAAEAEAAREARAKAIQVICFSLKVFSFSSVSPSRFFFFFLLIFVLSFYFLYLQPHHLLYLSNSREWAKAIQVISFSHDLLLFLFFCYFQCLSFSLSSPSLLVSATLLFVFPQCFSLSFFSFNLFVFATSSFVQTREPGQKAIQVSSLR